MAQLSLFFPYFDFIFFDVYEYKDKVWLADFKKKCRYWYMHYYILIDC